MANIMNLLDESKIKDDEEHLTTIKLKLKDYVFVKQNFKSLKDFIVLKVAEERNKPRDEYFEYE